MQTYAFPLAEAERPRLLPDRVRHADAPQVVREGGAPKQCDGVRRQLQPPGGRLGKVRHVGRVLAEPRRLEVRQGSDGAEAGIDPVVREMEMRKWLALQRVVPHARLVELGERIVEIPQRELDEPRLVRLAGPTLEDRARVIASRRR